MKRRDLVKAVAAAGLMPIVPHTSISVPGQPDLTPSGKMVLWFGKPFGEQVAVYENGVIVKSINGTQWTVDSKLEDNLAA